MISNKMKNDLDMLNYGCSINDLIDRDKLQDMTVLSEYIPNELIKNEFKYVYETIKDLNEKYKRKWQLGVISSGAHTEDYIKSYGLEIDDFSGWHNSSVMVVYECPGSNIDACMAMANNTEEDFWNNLDKILPEDNVDSLFDMLLCKTLWHADCGKKEYYNKKENTTIDSGAFKEFNAKTYSQFLIQLILEFKLSNLYTTNIF